MAHVLDVASVVLGVTHGVGYFDLANGDLNFLTVG